MGEEFTAAIMYSLLEETLLVAVRGLYATELTSNKDSVESSDIVGNVLYLKACQRFLFSVARRQNSTSFLLREICRKKPSL